MHNPRSPANSRFLSHYRCANNHPGPEHPRVRWREEQLERTIAEELGRTRLESDDMRGLVRTAMEAAFADLGSRQRKQAQLPILAISMTMSLSRRCTATPWP